MWTVCNYIAFLGTDQQDNTKKLMVVSLNESNPCHRGSADYFFADTEADGYMPDLAAVPLVGTQCRSFALPENHALLADNAAGPKEMERFLTRRFLAADGGVPMHQVCRLPFSSLWHPGRPVDHESSLAWHALDRSSELVQVGYPNGYIDTLSLEPIVQKSHCASHVHKCFCGKPEFLLNSPGIPGGSGSPILFSPRGITSSGYLVGFMQEAREGKGAFINLLGPFSEKGIVQIPILTNCVRALRAPVFVQVRSLL
jgi:hypothetical protein